MTADPCCLRAFSPVATGESISWAAEEEGIETGLAGSAVDWAAWGKTERLVGVRDMSWG